MNETILEIKETYFGKRKEFQCMPLSVTRKEAVVLYPIKRSRRIEDVDLPSGTHSIGYFWEDRFYNLYHWITPGGITLGLYYNIADQTRITSQQIEWRDLFVDILITPDGRCRVLDEDEVPKDMDASLRRRIEITRDELISGYRESLAQFEVISRQYLDEHAM